MTATSYESAKRGAFRHLNRPAVDQVRSRDILNRHAERLEDCNLVWVRSSESWIGRHLAQLGRDMGLVEAAFLNALYNIAGFFESGGA